MIKIISHNAETILEQYHQHLAANEQLSDATIGRYIAAVRNFASWYESHSGECFGLGSLSTSILLSYQTALREGGMKQMTVRQQIINLKSLFEWVASVTMPRDMPSQGL